MHSTGRGLASLHEDRTAFQFFAVGGQRGGELVHVAFDEVVLDEVGELFHPEQGDLVEDDAFVRDRLVHDDVKGGHAVRGDDEQGGVVDIVNIADLTSVEQGEFLDVGLGRDFHVTSFERWRGLNVDGIIASGIPSSGHGLRAAPCGRAGPRRPHWRRRRRGWRR